MEVSEHVNYTFNTLVLLFKIVWRKFENLSA